MAIQVLYAKIPALPARLPRGLCFTCYLQYIPSMASPLIMLVEDDKGIREIFADVLREEGYVVHTYGNGREALDALEGSEMPTLILLDWMMPVMTGQEFIQSDLGAAVSKLSPVVVISAIAKHLSNVPGIREFLMKPIDLDILLKTVNRYCVAEVA